MANPTVEKLKEAGLRYGDKVAVALTSLLFLVCFGLALNQKSIEITPEEVKKSAETADANLNRRQEPEAIIKVLEENKIKLTHFAKDVEDSAKTQLVADNYKPDREWFTPEPGAGLLRDQPVLIAPSELYAYPGRGGALVYELDTEGNRIVDTEKKEAPREERRGRRGRRGRGGMMGGMMGMMGGNAGMGGRRGSRQSQADMEREQKAEFEQRKREMEAKLAGRDAPAPKDEAEKKDDAANKPQEQWKETTKALRWVAITGILDHAKLVANYRLALKSPAAANPHYARLDLERQARQRDGTWSEWEQVNSDENLKVLDNLPEEDDELAPSNVRPDNLNDPLPFLKSGLWEKVHVASVVPKEKKEVAPPPGTAGGMMNEGGGMAAMMRGMGRMGSMGGGGGGGMAAMMRGMGGGGGGMSGMMRGMGGMGGLGRMGEGGMIGLGGGGDGGNYWKSEEKRVMIRALDFTAEPDTSYRYRVRIVVFNPNLKRDDVINSGVDTKSKELNGPWSEPTDEVNMPADVSAYAMGVMPRDPKSDLKVNFQVVRFEQKNGVTVPRKFAAGPGEVVGEISTADIPTSEGTGKQARPVDFDTRQIVLDTAGGLQPLPAGFAGGAVDRPALALLLRPDGSVQVRAQADDANDEVRKDIERNYAREVKDSNKKRESSMGSGYGGMMNMMMGGGGMGPMGGMGGGRR